MLSITWKSKIPTEALNTNSGVNTDHGYTWYWLDSKDIRLDGGSLYLTYQVSKYNDEKKIGRETTYILYNMFPAPPGNICVIFSILFCSICY